MLGGGNRLWAVEIFLFTSVNRVGEAFFAKGGLFFCDFVREDDYAIGT